MKFSMFPQPVGFFKLVLNLVCRSNTQGRELCWHDFIRYMFNIVMCQDTYELICFKLGMMLDTTKLYSSDSSLNDLDVYSRSQSYRKARTCAVICCKVA